MVGHRCATPSGSVISKYCSCWWTREVVILTSEFGNTTMGRYVGEQWGCNRECPSQLFTTLWVLVLFSFTYPNVAALMDIPYISRSSAVHPTLQVLALIQSFTYFLPISFWPFCFVGLSLFLLVLILQCLVCCKINVLFLTYLFILLSTTIRST